MKRFKKKHLSCQSSDIDGTENWQLHKSPLQVTLFDVTQRERGQNNNRPSHKLEESYAFDATTKQVGIWMFGKYSCDNGRTIRARA